MPEGLGIGLGLGLGLVPEGYCRAEQRRIELLEEVSTHLQARGPHRVVRHARVRVRVRVKG